MVKKYEKKLADMPKPTGPDFILEPNPDGPAISHDKLQLLRENDNTELH